MSIRLLLTYFIFPALILSSCNCKDMRFAKSDVSEKISFERFERELFMMDLDTLPQSIPGLYKKYDDFLDVFSYNIIGIGSPSQRDYQAYLTMFVNDRQNREIFKETERVFPDLEILEAKISKAFSIYKESFPNAQIPRVLTCITGFNKSCFTIGNYAGISLDLYLGSSSPFYKKLDLPQYMKLTMFPEKIPSDLMHTFASALFVYNDSIDNVLARMIHEGKIYYFTKHVLPGEPDSLIIGYSKKQMKWVEENEEQMWTYLVEKKILFSREPLDIRKLTGQAPFTYFFSNESPGKAGAYIGWRIFTEYAERNAGLSFSELMAETDYEKILRSSKYNP